MSISDWQVSCLLGLFCSFGPRNVGCGAQELENSVVLRTNQRDGDFVPLVIDHDHLVLREQDVRVVGAEHIAADDDLD